MPMQMPAKEISMGQEILVDVGRGKSRRIVDRVQHDEGHVTLTLYTESGVRPKIRLTDNHMVEIP